jgi:hypothetical protein
MKLKVNILERWFLRRLLRRYFAHRVPISFLRNDGRSATLDVCLCSVCRNHFWIQHAMIELPTFCPYCGVRFEHTSWSGPEINEQIVL